jgi:hypothetical protein
VSYCDFKVGDEVVCVEDESVNWNVVSGLVVGATYTITSVFEDKVGYDSCNRAVGVTLAEVPPPGEFSGFKASWFRKVQRRDLTAWLGQTATYDEEQHAPAPVKRGKERVS